MDVEVQAFANLAGHLPPGPRPGVARLTLRPGATIDDLLGALGLASAVPRLVLVNGREAEAGMPLAAGDVVSLIPPLEGG